MNAVPAANEIGDPRERVVGALHGLYKNVFSPIVHFGGLSGCRFQPTCSDYAAIAVAQHGFARGGWMALRRLLRCHPLQRGGFDPVPMRESRAPVTIKESQSKIRSQEAILGRNT